MKKEQLKKLRKLCATPAMMQKAGMDVPEIVYRKNSWREEDIYRYKYGVYMRCQILKGILKVSFYLADRMRLGLNDPVYNLFINKETGEFVTWDVKNKKWRNAKVDMLDWPGYTYYSGRYINPEGNQSIKRYLGTEKSGYAGILEYQKKVRKEALKQEYRRETEPWDLEMDKVPELPKDWLHWVDKQVIREHFIFYDYSRKGTKEGYCTWCEKIVPIKNPKHNQHGTCQKCGHKIQYKARGRAGNICTDNERAYLIQRCEGGFVIREFICWKRLIKENYECPRYFTDENRRVIYDRDFNAQVFCWLLYRNDHYRWVKTNARSIYYEYSSFWYNGQVYKRTLPSLGKNELQRTGLLEMSRSVERFDPEAFIGAWKRNPKYEQFAKAGLGALLENPDGTVKAVLENNEKIKDLARELGIDKARMKRLRKNKGGKLFLKWLQKEKALNTVFPDKIIRYFAANGIYPERLKEMLTRMSYQKIYNFLKKQSRISGRRPAELIGTWEDYICMANRLKMDTWSEIHYKPKDLKKAHDDAVAVSGGADITRRAGEIDEMFPGIDELYAKIRTKYEYTEKKYSIVVPEKIEEIIMEGKVLGHCLHNSDRYFDRLKRRETYIVFLRRTEEIDKPYYTLEIEPDGTARQKRTVGDNKNADFKEAEKFIRRWQREVLKRLDEEDLRLAEISRKLRLEEFEELRKEKKKVWHGKLAGQLLVDVLEADLMEAQRMAAC